MAEARVGIAAILISMALSACGDSKDASGGNGDPPSDPASEGGSDGTAGTDGDGSDVGSTDNSTEGTSVNLGELAEDYDDDPRQLGVTRVNDIGADQYVAP